VKGQNINREVQSSVNIVSFKLSGSSHVDTAELQHPLFSR